MMTALNHAQGSQALQQLIAAYASREAGNCIFLPSLMSLGETLHCSAFEIHQHLTELQQQGYRFLVFDLNSPITLWYQTAA